MTTNAELEEIIKRQSEEIESLKQELDIMTNLFLDVIEDHGKMESLYAIACEVLQ